MVMIKNGKPVVPSASDKKNKDIYAPKPNFNVTNKPKEMKTKTEKMSIDTGFGNQYRTNEEALGKPSNSSKSDEISRNGK